MVEMTLLQHFMILVWTQIIGNTFYEAFIHKCAARLCTIQNGNILHLNSDIKQELNEKKKM